MQDTKFIKVPHQGSQGTTYPSWRRDTWSIIEVKIGHWSLSPYEGHVPVCLAICYPGLLQPSLPRISIWNHLNINTSVGAGTRLLQLVFGRVYLYFYVHGDETIMIIIYISLSWWSDFAPPSDLQFPQFFPYPKHPRYWRKVPIRSKRNRVGSMGRTKATKATSTKEAKVTKTST